MVIEFVIMLLFSPPVIITNKKLIMLVLFVFKKLVRAADKYMNKYKQIIVSNIILDNIYKK